MSTIHGRKMPIPRRMGYNCPKVGDWVYSATVQVPTQVASATVGSNRLRSTGSSPQSYNGSASQIRRESHQKRQKPRSTTKSPHSVLDFPSHQSWKKNHHKSKRLGRVPTLHTISGTASPDSESWHKIGFPTDRR